MKNSIKFIAIIVVMATVVISCKKVDGPKPSNEAYLTSKTWSATKAEQNGSTVTLHPENCNGFILQFSHDGKIYSSDGTTSSCVPSHVANYTLEDMTIDYGFGTMTIISLDANNLVLKFQGNTYYMAPVTL